MIKTPSKQTRNCCCVVISRCPPTRIASAVQMEANEWTFWTLTLTSSLALYHNTWFDYLTLSSEFRADILSSVAMIWFPDTRHTTTEQMSISYFVIRSRPILRSYIDSKNCKKETSTVKIMLMQIDAKLSDYTLVAGKELIASPLQGQRRKRQR